jgi:hypothetical protein
MCTVGYPVASADWSCRQERAIIVLQVCPDHALQVSGISSREDGNTRNILPRK